MEGHTRHSGSHYYTPPPQSSASAAASFQKVYANAAAGFGAPPSAPRAEQFSEMFRSFRSGKACSLPTLDLPPNDDSVSAFDFVYSEIFGGFDFADFAVSFDQLFRRSDGIEDSSDYARTQVGTEPLPEDADPSASSGRNQYFQDGDFHQTTESKVNMGEDSNPIHVAELSAVPGNSYIYDYEGSNLQQEVEERYSSEVADDVILHEDSSGSIFVETQSKTASNPSILSHGSGGKAGRPYGINLSPTGIYVSDDCLTTEPSHSPPTSRPPPSVVDTKKDPASSVSDSERPPKGNAAKALFDIGSLDFLNVEFDTGSSAIASAAAIKEAMDRAKVKLERARESTERKKDDAKGTRPVMKNDMKGVGKVRMLFETGELQREHKSEYSLFNISGKGMLDVSEASQVLPYHLQAENTHNGATKCPQSMVTKNQDSSEIPKVDEKSRKRENEVCEKDANETKLKEAEKRTVSAHDLATKSLKLKRSNTNKFGDEEADEERGRPMQESKSENVEKMCEDSAINEDKKMYKGDLHADLKSTDQDSYERKHVNVKSEYSTSSVEPSTLDVRNNKVPEMTCEFEGLKSFSLAGRLVEKNIKSTAVACEDDEIDAAEFILVDEEKGELRSGILFGEVESNVAEMEDICMSTKHLQMTEADRPMMTEERERERKLEKLHHKRLEEWRERERENELDKNRVRKIEEERHMEREKELKKERLRKLVKERKRERERKKDSIGVELTTSAAHERASAETHEGADRVAVETAAAEARQRAMAEARERLEKACAEARGKSFSEKSSTEARMRAERAAVLRANAEARERAIEKAIAERATFEAREQVERSASEKFSPPLRDIKLRHTSSSSDLCNSDKSNEVEEESAQRCRSSLERHCRTVERVAKALAEKNMRDLNAQKEEAEKNRLAESLDADIKRWSSGKEGNLRALLSTLQYILGPNSGWHPIPLTEVISSAAVKKAYRKATLCVHPDKLQQRGATIQQKYICEKVFDLLQDSWNKFSSEEW